MLCKNKSIYISNNYACWLYAFFITLTAAVSCRQPASNAKQAYFDSVLKKIDSSVDDSPYHYVDADMAYLDAAFSSLQNPGISNIAEKNLRKLAYYAGSKSDYATALLYADSNTSLLQNHTANTKLANIYVKTLFAKGDLCFRVKNYDEAIHNYTTGKLILSASKPEAPVLYDYYNSMASILYAQQKYLLAANFFRLKYKTAPASKKTPYAVYLAVQENLDNTGMCYQKAGITDSALYYYNATLDYISQNEKKFPLADSLNFAIERSVVYGNLAEMAYQQKDTAGAEKLFIKSMQGAKTYDDTTFTKILRLSLVSLYLETNQLKKAGGLLLDTARFISPAEISRTAGNYYKLLTDYYIKTNQPFAANSSLLHACNIRDSLEKRDRRFNTIDVRREFENREQYAANQALKKDNEIKNGYLLIAIISAAMAFVIVLLIWNNLRRKSRFVKKLTYLNTEISKKNNDLQKTLNSLEQSHTENNRIMRIVAHDLKNPISAIRTLVYSMLKKEQTGPDREALELIQATCTESVSLIKDLLDNKRKLSDMSKELVDMGRLIEQCTELFRVKAGEKNQHLKLQVDYPVIMLNRQRMWRVISNIVNNAIKFSPANAEITIRLERKNDSVLLSVQDNGIGIPAGLKDYIFTLNPAASRKGTAGEESYGLGLSISRKIIEEHEGRLWFESNAGAGSVFYVQLPYSVN